LGHSKNIREQRAGVLGPATVSAEPDGVRSIDGNGEISLAETLESTGEPTIAEHGILAKGSTGDEPEPALDSAVAATLAAGSTGSLAESGGGDALRDSAVQPGAHLGRLEIRETLGTGAFGVVVAAYDPKLKRKLAVKILRPEVFGSRGGHDAQKRLMREARAMAKISHPNVVTVHDIGTFHGQVYIAMEFVAGSHLRAWLAKEKRSWQEIVETFSSAGRGLAAAHHEGLVHRDFKPDNVLVSSSGAVRVADFGLVSISSNSEAVASSEFEVPRSSSEELDITRVGAVMGTALYMAPEQHRGHEAGPSADQFSFCVALYSALCGQQPFKGDNYEELRDNVLEGKLQAPPSGTGVPKRIWPILATGMSLDPASRHESMDVLLSALADNPLPRRKKQLQVAALVLAGAGAMAAFTLSRSNTDSICQHAADKLQGTWDSTTKGRLAQTYSSASRSDEFSRLRGAVDQYTGDWVSVRTRVCEATNLVGDQSESLLDLRMMCLDQRLGYLGELLGRLEQGADAEMLDKAVTASLSLPSLDSCTRQDAISMQMPLPAGVDERNAIAALDRSVDKAQALFDLGEPKAARDVLQGALKKPVDYPPSMGKLTNLLGKTLSDMGELDEGERLLNKSVEYATAAGDDLLVASSWLALMHIVGVERENYESGYEMGRMAHLALIRGKANAISLAGANKATAMIMMREGKASEAIALMQSDFETYQEEGDETEFAFYLGALADAKAGDGLYKEAIADYRLSLAHLESVLGPNHPEIVYVLNNLAVALKNNRETSEARKVLERSLAIVEATYGKTHRGLVTILLNLGNLARREGDLEGAKEILERAIAVGNEVMEPGHPTVTKAIMNLGIVLISEGDYPGATGRFLVVLERAKRSFDGDHPDVAMALNNVGESLSLENKPLEGLPYVMEAMEMKTRLYGSGHPKTASSIATVGTINAKLGRVGMAERYLQQALDIYLEAAGEEHPRTIAMLSALGQLHQGNGANRKASPLLVRAIAARGDTPSSELAADRFSLAKARWAQSDPKGAQEQVDALRTLFSSLEDSEEQEQALNRWLKTR